MSSNYSTWYVTTYTVQYAWEGCGAIDILDTRSIILLQIWVACLELRLSEQQVGQFNTMSLMLQMIDTFQWSSILLVFSFANTWPSSSNSSSPSLKLSLVSSLRLVCYRQLFISRKVSSLDYTQHEFRPYSNRLCAKMRVGSGCYKSIISFWSHSTCGRAGGYDYATTTNWIKTGRGGT